MQGVHHDSMAGQAHWLEQVFELDCVSVLCGESNDDQAVIFRYARVLSTFQYSVASRWMVRKKQGDSFYALYQFQYSVASR